MFTKLLAIILNLLVTGLDIFYSNLYTIIMYLSQVFNMLNQYLGQVFHSALSFLFLLNLFVPVDLFAYLSIFWLGWRLVLHSKKFLKWIIEVITP